LLAFGVVALVSAACDTTVVPPEVVTTNKVPPESTTPIPPEPTTAYVVTRTSATDVLTAVTLDSGAVQWSVNLPGEVLGVAVSTTVGSAYVLTGNSGDATLTPVSLATGSVGSPITVGMLARSVVVSPDGSEAYVVNGGGGILALPQPDGSTVTPVDLRTDQALPPITVGDGPGGIAIVNHATAYVSRVLAGAIERVNLLDGRIGPLIGVPSSQNRAASPADIAVSPDGRLVAVGNLQQDLGYPAPVVNLVDLDTGRWHPAFRLAGSTNAVSELAFSADGQRLYVLAHAAVNVVDAIYIIDVADGSVIQSPDVVDGLVGAAFAPDSIGSTVYLAAGQADETTAIVPIDARSGAAHARIAVLPGSPVAMAVDR